MSVQYKAYIATSVQPHEIIAWISEDLRLPETIKPSWAERAARDNNSYSCEVPLGLEGLPATVSDHIRVSVGAVTSGAQVYVDSVFDILGITKQGGPSVNIVLYQPYYDQFPVTDEAQAYDFYVKGYLLVLRVMGTVFRFAEGDGFMFRDGITECEFIRKNGTVMVDMMAEYWDEQEKQALGLPLTIGKIPRIF